MIRTAAAWLQATCVAVLVALLLLPLVDLSFTRALPVLQALWGAWAALALLGAALGFALRRRLVGAALVVALLTGGAPIVLTGASQGASGGPTLTVLAANLEFGQGDPAAVAQAVADIGADVVVLVEVDPAYLDRLRALGLDRTLPHGWAEPVGGAQGTTILSRLPLDPVTRWPDRRPFSSQMPVVRMELAGREVVLRAVHTLPPVQVSAPLWRTELAELDHWVRRVPEDVPLVLAGDFNAARVHPGLRQIAHGMSVAPSALARTWPAEGRAPAFAGIDHVLARGATSQASGTVLVPGSDHHAVWARLRLEER